VCKTFIYACAVFYSMPQLTEEDLAKMSPEQIAELQKQNCFFCQIGSGKAQAKMVYEDELCFAILDINPAIKGHMLLLPKEHYMILPQIPEETIKHLGVIAKKLSRTVLRALGAEGTNIFIANGAIAGQRAPHLIIHIIPRTENDSITAFDLPEKDIREEDLLKLQKMLTKKLGMNFEPQQEMKVQKSKNLEEIDLHQLRKMLI